MKTVKIITTFFRALLLIAAAGIVLVAAVIVLLQTGIGGRYLLDFAGSKTGLELSAEKISVGIGGQLRLSGFSATINGLDKPFFTAQRIEITATALSDALYTRDFRLHTIKILNPSITLRTAADGQLEIGPLFETFRPRTKSSQVPFSLPEIRIVNGTFTYEQPKKTPITAREVNFSVVAGDNQVLYLDLTLPGNNTLSGTLQTETLEHQFALCLGSTADLPEHLRDEIPPRLTVQADWHGQFSSQTPRQMQALVHLHQLRTDDIEVSGQAEVTADAQTFTAHLKQLRLNPWAKFPFVNEPIDPITATSGTLTYTFAPHEIEIHQAVFGLLNGTASIEGVIYPRQWTQSRLTSTLENLHLRPLLDHTDFEDTTLSGTLQIEPAADHRAAEPMAFDIDMRLDGQFFRTAETTHITAAGWLSDSRLVTTRAEIPFFGGIVKPWVSLNRREQGLFTHLIGNFENIDLYRLVNAFSPEPIEIPGTLSGTMRCRASGSLKTLSGSADIALTDSDLINTDIVGTLYSSMNMAFGRLDKRGNGTMRITAHGDKVEILSFEYFNRGAEMRGAGVIEALTQGIHSPVSGFATGTMRPLRETKIPGTKDLDRLISSMQAGLATVRIEGTLGDPSARVVPLPEVQNAFRTLLWQQKKSD